MMLMILAACTFVVGTVGAFVVPVEVAGQIASVILWTLGTLACLVTLAIAGPIVALLLAGVLLLVKLACR